MKKIILDDTYEINVYEMAAILSRGRCVKDILLWNWFRHSLLHTYISGYTGHLRD